MLLINGILAYGLVLGHFGLPAMGMNGAAVVAVIVNLFSLVFIVVYIQTQEETRQYELFVRFWKPDWKALAKSCVSVFPSASPFWRKSRCFRPLPF